MFRANIVTKYESNQISVGDVSNATYIDKDEVSRKRN